MCDRSACRASELGFKLNILYNRLTWQRRESLYEAALSYHVISIQAHDRQSERWRTRYKSIMTPKLMIIFNQTD